MIERAKACESSPAALTTAFAAISYRARPAGCHYDADVVHPTGKNRRLERHDSATPFGVPAERMHESVAIDDASRWRQQRSVDC